MAHKILVTIEFGDDGTYSCYSEQPIGEYALIDGDGATASEAKADFLRAVEECRQAYPEDARYTGLTFEYKYDLRSFFNYFNFLNFTNFTFNLNCNVLRFLKNNFCHFFLLINKLIFVLYNCIFYHPIYSF